MTISEILRNSRLSPLNAELILSFILKKPREYLFTHPEKKLTKPQIAEFNNLVKRREKGEPIAYLTGKKEFYGLDFFVNKNVLIPRPETELLVEAALRRIMNYDLRIKNIVDIGTGSGNIIISVVKNIPAKKRKNINFFATDISKKALTVAKKNAKKYKVSKSIKFIKSDLFNPAFVNKLRGNSLIIANLPYVSEGLYQKKKESLKHEPKEALVSDNYGLKHYKRLARQMKKSLFFYHYSLIIEISPEQKNALYRIIKRELPPAKIKFFKDLRGRVRIAVMEISGKN